jgi:hypothetical protein
MIFRTFLSLLCAIGLAACASPIESSQPISSTFGAAARTSLSRSVRLLDWNVHKGTRTRFGSEFVRLTRNADVIVLQEMSTHGAGRGPQGTVTAISGRSYVMAHADPLSRWIRRLRERRDCQRGSIESPADKR